MNRTLLIAVVSLAGAQHASDALAGPLANPTQFGLGLTNGRIDPSPGPRDNGHGGAYARTAESGTRASDSAAFQEKAAKAMQQQRGWASAAQKLQNGHFSLEGVEARDKLLQKLRLDQTRWNANHWAPGDQVHLNDDQLLAQELARQGLSAPVAAVQAPTPRLDPTGREAVVPKFDSRVNQYLSAPKPSVSRTLDAVKVWRVEDIRRVGQFTMHTFESDELIVHNPLSTPVSLTELHAGIYPGRDDGRAELQKRIDRGTISPGGTVKLRGAGNVYRLSVGGVSIGDVQIQKAERNQEQHLTIALPAPNRLALAPVAGPVVGSPFSKEAARLQIHNQQASAIELLWVDAHGNAKPYRRIAAGETVQQDTFLGHRWIIRSGDTTLGQLTTPAGISSLTVN